mmetsp:Transcript_112878/g.350394  ORF Transcript_112878/g.350394 Transcript_112878/m.350394 type:complete len:436 (+) Transcript_112878:2-1309(+)
MNDGQRWMGYCKSYSSKGGYGFFSSEGLSQDVFFSKRDLPGELQEEHILGQPFSFDIGIGKDGRRQASKVQWLNSPDRVAMGAGVDMNFVEMEEHKGKGKGKFKGKFKGKPDEISEGMRLRASLRSIGKEGGSLECPFIQGELQFYVHDLPSILQREIGAESPETLLQPGADLIFTVAMDQLGQYQAKQVMLAPGAEDLFFGEITSYNVHSGYGFIKAAEDSTFTHDVYFNTKDMQDVPEEDLRKNLLGVACGFNIRMTADGRPQAKRIELISKPEGVAPGDESAENTGRVLHGTIKTFKQSNGYGFISCPELGRDVWFARRELPIELMRKTLHLPGTEVGFELWVTENDKPQARAVKEVQPAEGAAPAGLGGQAMGAMPDTWNQGYGGGGGPRGGYSGAKRMMGGGQEEEPAAKHFRPEGYGGFGGEFWDPAQA